MKNQARTTFLAILGIVVGIIAWVPSALGLMTTDYAFDQTILGQRLWHLEQALPLFFSDPILGGIGIGLLGLAISMIARQQSQKDSPSRIGYRLATIGTVLGGVSIFTSLCFTSRLWF